MRFSASIILALSGTAVLATPLVKSDNVQTIDKRVTPSIPDIPNMDKLLTIPDLPGVPQGLPDLDGLPEAVAAALGLGGVSELPAMPLTEPDIVEPAVPFVPSISPVPFPKPNSTNSTIPKPSSSVPLPSAVMPLNDAALPLPSFGPQDPVPFANAVPSKTKRDAMPQPDPLSLKLPSIVPPTIPNIPGGAGGACTNNTQTNQCQSGIPYCCSPDGNGGRTCENANVNCKQTIICCNNFNGFQFCMGDMDFNIPITINLNLGGKKKN